MSIDQQKDELSIIRTIIYRETRYLRHYLGKVLVNQDEVAKGRVCAQIPELGFGLSAAGDDPTTGLWCWPRDRHSMDVPNVGEWVEVYFMAGDPRRPVYLGQASELTGNEPAAFDGNPSTRIIFQDPVSGDHIKYNAETGDLEAIVTGSLDLKDGVGNEIKSSPTELKMTAFGVTIHLTSLGIKLESGDASTWVPNTLAIDPFTAAPHGGVLGGISKLMGG